MLALQGIRILDLSRVLAGPYCTQLLADYGAGVIKVEQPGQGDGTRQWGPPWVGVQSAYFLAANRNKRSLTLNLKHPRGRELLCRLAQRADILIENFKVGSAAEMGLDYATLSELNPALIYCSISGYGQTGPAREAPGYDFMIQAEGGIMSITGPAEGEPSKVGVAIADITAGLFAATAILAALHERQQSGRGQYVDVALFDAQLAWLANVAHNFFATGESPARYGNAHPNIVPYQTFATQDGHLALAIGTDDQYRRFCTEAGCPELWEDVRFQTNAGRVAQRRTLIPLLEAVLRRRNTSDWLDLCRRQEIPAAPINQIPEALNHSQAQARQMIQEVDHPTQGKVKVLGPVAKLSRTPASVRSAPPLLGEHTDEILVTELGLSSVDLAELRRLGAI